LDDAANRYLLLNSPKKKKKKEKRKEKRKKNPTIFVGILNLGRKCKA
jgi:hypothetical protein